MESNSIRDSLIDAKKLLEEFIDNEKNINSVLNAGQIMTKAIKEGNKIIACGNGGSLSDAMHFAAELTGRFHKSRFPLPAVAISDPVHISCISNDYGYDYIFSRFIEANVRAGDVLLAISTSANSPNVLKAAESATNKGIKIIGLTGNNGGKLGPLCDIEIRAPLSEYSDRAQEIHIKIIHCLVEYIEQQLL